MAVAGNLLVKPRVKETEQLYLRDLEISKIEDFKNYEMVSAIAFNGIVSPLVSLYEERLQNLLNDLNFKTNRKDVILGRISVKEGSADYFGMSSKYVNSVPSMMVYYNGKEKSKMCIDVGMLFNEKKFLSKIENNINSVMKEEGIKIF